MATRKEVRAAIMADRKLARDREHFLDYNKQEQRFWLRGIQFCIELQEFGEVFEDYCRKHDNYADMVAELSW